MRSLRLADSNYYIQINDKDLPYSTGNCIQYHVISSNGKGKKRASVSIISRQWPQNKHNVIVQHSARREMTEGLIGINKKEPSGLPGGSR